MGDARPCRDPKLFHHFKSTGLIGAWVRRPSDNERLYIGSYKGSYIAARAQDRATLKISPDSGVLNFAESDYDEDEELRNSMDETSFLKMLRGEARQKYKVVAKSPCYLKFAKMEEERLALKKMRSKNKCNSLVHWNKVHSPYPEPTRDVIEAAGILGKILYSGDTSNNNHNVAKRARYSINEDANGASTSGKGKEPAIDK